MSQYVCLGCLTFDFVRCSAADGFVAWLACRWRAATQLSGASLADDVVQAFWAAIGELTEDERGMVRHLSSASYTFMQAQHPACSNICALDVEGSGGMHSDLIIVGCTSASLRWSA